MSKQSGGEWLLQFLYDQGLRGETLKRLWAIGMRESGGNPRVDNRGLNGDGSVDYGLFQINDKAHSAAIKKKFGWSMEDLRDPDKNVKVMLWMSQQGQNLSAWGVSNPDGSVTGWAKSIGDAKRKQFESAMFARMDEFDDVVKKVGIDPGTGVRTVDGRKDDAVVTDAMGKPLVKKDRKIATNYGLSWAFINSDPDLAAWFKDFAKRYRDSQGKISYETFALELNQVPIIKNNSAAWLQDWQLEAENPEVYNKALQGNIETLRDQAAALGVTLDDGELRDIAKKARRMGLNPSQVNNLLAQRLGGDGQLKGQAEADTQTLKQWAQRNGLSISPNTINQYVQRIAAGDMSVDDAKQEWRKTYLAGSFPAWQEQINNGQDPYDLAMPYMELGRSVLERDNLDLNDPTMKQIMQYVGADGKPQLVPLWEAEKMFRARPEWQKTDNAYRTYTDVATGILKTWGLM